MGSGGVGGFYGARLARAGEDVTFIARGAHLEAIRKNGLRVESAEFGDFTVAPAQATDDPSTLGVADMVLMATKAYDLDAAAEAMRPLVGADTIVLPLLNGVDIAERLGAVLGMERIVGGTVQVMASIKEPGVILHGAMDRVVFGELGGGTSPRCEALREVMRNAGIGAETAEDIHVEIWKKFLFLSAGAGLASLTRQPLHRFRADPDTRALLESCMLETEAVARARGVALPESVVADSMAFLDSRPEGAQFSMAYDLSQGKRLELDALQGALVRLGRDAGVPTPANGFIYAALKLWANGAE